MPNTMLVTLKDGSTIGISINNYPNECPQCHKMIQAKFFGAFMNGEDKIDSIFQCVNQKCLKIFIATYSALPPDPMEFILTSIGPIKPLYRIFSDIINNTSPLFVEIYNQAIASESFSLNQLTGIGLRKALEYLIKDYCISKHSEYENEIKDSTLGNCIKTYIDDSNVKLCAERATWLGNDETHYIRKWEDRDINDLKILIDLIINWINNIYLTNKYLSTMP